MDIGAGSGIALVLMASSVTLSRIDPVSPDVLLVNVSGELVPESTVIVRVTVFVALLARLNVSEYGPRAAVVDVVTPRCEPFKTNISVYVVPGVKAKGTVAIVPAEIPFMSVQFPDAGEVHKDPKNAPPTTSIVPEVTVKPPTLCPALYVPAATASKFSEKIKAAFDMDTEHRSVPTVANSRLGIMASSDGELCFAGLTNPF